MNSLLVRMLALCVVVGVLSGVLCSWIGVRSVTRTMNARHEVVQKQADQDVAREVQEMLDQLEFEISEYARWDEMYENAPAPAPAWAALNLVPGGKPGRLCQVMIIIDGGRVVGRYDFHGPRGAETAPGDRAEAAAIIAVCAGRNGRGLAWLDGQPALWMAMPIVRTDGTGLPHGQLVGLAYLTEGVVARLAPFGWSTRILTPAEPPAASDGQWLRHAVALPGSDAVIRVEVAQLREPEIEARARLIHDVALASMALPLAACLVGMLLIWRWMAPLRELSAACRRRTTDPDVAIPDGGEFTETRQLAASLRSLVEAEHAVRKRMAADLAGAETAHAVQRSQVQRLATELDRPIQVMLEKSRRLSSSGGLLPPEDAAALVTAAETIQLHLQDVSSLARDGDSGTPTGATDLAAFAAEVSVLLQAQAGGSGTAITVAAEGWAVIDATLIAPALVNLLANAIAAAPGTTIALRGGVDDGGVWWEVEDHGPGLPEPLVKLVQAACGRGAVLPGDKGLGFGLALVVANTARAGGRVRLLRSGPQGVLFRIELPAG